MTAPEISAEVVLRETGCHPNITRHRERMADRIDADHRVTGSVWYLTAMELARRLFTQ